MSWTRLPKQDLDGETDLVRKALLRYLGRREYTTVELRQRLKERGATDADIAAALSYAKERGYQDDARAGESHIRQRLHYAPRGRALVRQELMERGLPAGLCSTLLDEHYPPEEEQKLLRRLLAKEVCLEKSPSKQTQLEQAQLEQAQQGQAQLGAELSAHGDAQKAQRLRRKMARRLLAKGFCRSAVIEALEEWLPKTDEEYFVDDNTTRL